MVRDLRMLMCKIHDRAQVSALAEQSQEATGGSVEVTSVDQGVYRRAARERMPRHMASDWKW